MAVPTTLSSSKDAMVPAQGPLPFERPRVRTFNKERAQATLEEYQKNPLDNDSYVDPDTQNRRDRIWENWQRFAEDMGVDPNKVWIDLCKGVDGIQPIFQAFLEEYVQSSYTLRPCLGPEEYVLVRTINHGSTVTDTWVSLVNEVNRTVLKNKKNEDPDNASFWSLSLSSRDIGTGQGAAYEIGRWIPHLADKLGLSCEQSFVKSEMTAEDVIFCLDTVWTRAKDIPCRPNIRLGFHCATLLGGIGGWRPGSLVNIRYKDIELGWVRDPNIPSRTQPVVFITIHHVKQKKHQIQRDQRSRLTFGMTVVPYKLLCLVTLLTTRAIVDNAFKAGFNSCDQVLRPGPLEEGVEFVRLEWRDEVLKENKKIVPISYKQFVDIWNRVHFVVGSRERKRPYSLRVGAGGRLDGSLTAAVRNYTLGNSTAVFERSYQPVQIREALAEIAFGELGKQDENLWSVICNAFLRRDPFAPIYITQEEMAKFQERNDITILRKQVVEVRNKHGLASKEEQKIWGRIQWIIDCLEKLQLEKNRKAYFAKVDGLRALGKTTIHLHDPQAANPRRVVFKDSSAAAQKLSALIADRMPPATLPDKIVAYLRGETPEGNESAGPVTEDSKILELEPSEKPRCLLGCCDQFFNRASLTRHVNTFHEFKNPFSCPECKHLGLVECWIEANPCAWSNHVERIHGKIHAPHVQPNNIKRAYCPLCRGVFAARGFTQHLNKKHSEDFFHSFQCPECPLSSQTKECLIGGRDFWVAHVRDAHGGGEIPGAVLVSDEEKDCKQLNIKRKRQEPAVQLEEEDLVRARPGKKVRQSTEGSDYESDYESDYVGDWDWTAEGSPSPHADEEFWVSGRD